MTMVVRRPPAPVALRIAAVALAVAAAWGPRVGAPSAVSRTVLFDVSASAETSRIDGRDLLAGLDGDDTFRLIAFADGATTLSDEDTRVGDARDAGILRAVHGVALGRHASDLAAALRRAAAVATHAGRREEVLVVSDRRATNTPGELQAAALALRESGCSSLEFLDVESRALAPRVAVLQGPGRARRGQVFSLVASGDAGARGGRLQLTRSGHVVNVRDLPPGPFRVQFPVRNDRVGVSIHEVRFEAGPERPAPRARVVVGEPRSALALVTDGDTTWARRALPEALGERTTVIDPRDGRLASLLPGYDVVVVPRVAPPPQTRAVLDAWSAQGGGLLLIGDVVWDAVSPLRSVPPDDPGAFLFVALDGSGSMSERWSGRDERTRDSVVRAAVRELAADMPDELTVALRRFNDRLLPHGGPPWTGRPGAGDGVGFGAALDGLAAPAGGTLLVPVLREAAALAASHGGPSRRMLVFTDGRVGDPPESLAGAVALLGERGCGLTLVVDDEEGRDALSEALAETAAEIVYITDSAALTGALRAAAARVRPPPGVLGNVALRAGPAAAAIPGLVFPPQADRVVRRWTARGAGGVVETPAGVPVAAVRAHGLGRVAAVSVLPSDAWPHADDRAWITALRGAVEGHSAETLRVARDADRLLVRATADEVPVAIEIESAPGTDPWRAPLRPAGDGLLAAELPEGGDSAIVRLLDGEGRSILATGLDRPASPEYRDPASVDADTLSALAVGSAPGEGPPLRPWLAAAAVLCVLAGHVLAARQLSSRQGDLPM